jgi:dienelactone hydrolase
MTLRDRAIEALARIIVGEHDWPLLNDAEAEYAEQRAAEAFDAMVPGLVWEEVEPTFYCTAVGAKYHVYREPSGWTMDGDNMNKQRGFADPASAQAAAEAHHIAQRLAGTALWKAMEEMNRE